MRVLLTGGTGTVGLSLADFLLRNGIHTVLYAITPPPAEALLALAEHPGEIGYTQGDVLDRAGLERAMAEHRIDTVVHGAAVTPDESAERRDAAGILRVNCVGALEALAAAAAAGVHRFLYIGSIAAYGTAARTAALLEEDATHEVPENLYEISKFAAEKAVIRAADLLGVDAVAARVGDVFGKWEHRTSMRGTLSAPFATTRLARSGAQARLPRPGLKPWVYSEDVAGALHALLTTPELRHRLYNVGSEFSWSIEEWCALLAERYRGFRFKVSARDANVRFFDDNAPMSLARLRDDTGFCARFDRDAAFDDYLAWVERHPWFVDGDGARG